MIRLWKDARLHSRSGHYVVTIMWVIGLIYIAIRGCKPLIPPESVVSVALINATPDLETFLYSRYVRERDNESEYGE